MNGRILATLMCVLGSAVAIPHAEATTLQPNEATSKDSFVYQFLPTFNFNGGGFGTILSAGKTGVGHDTQSLLQFDLSTVTLTPAQIAAPSFQSSFQIYVGSTSAAGFGVNPDAAHPIQIDLVAIGGASPTWGEDTVTWGTMPSTTGGIVASATVDDINKYFSFDTTSLVKQWLNGSLANNGFMLVEDAVVGTDPNFYVAVFDSSAGAHAPLLSVVPEPASLAIALTAAPWLAWRWKRRRVRRSDAAR